MRVEPRGRERLNHLNPVPLQDAVGRWISRYEQDWAAALVGLRDTVEAAQRRLGRQPTIANRSIRPSCTPCQEDPRCVTSSRASRSPRRSRRCGTRSPAPRGAAAADGHRAGNQLRAAATRCTTEPGRQTHVHRRPDRAGRAAGAARPHPGAHHPGLRADAGHLAARGADRPPRHPGERRRTPAGRTTSRASIGRLDLGAGSCASSRT